MVLEESRSHLAALAKLAPRLNDATDRYMEELEEIEATLAKLNLGLEVESSPFLLLPERIIPEEYSGSPERLVQTSFSLGYGRCVNSWHLLVHEDEHETRPEDQWVRIESKPLLACARHLRIAAAPAIPHLLERLTAEAERSIASINEVSNR